MGATLIDRFQQTAARCPSAPAFVADSALIRYRQAFALLCVAARLLHHQGVRPGDAVAVSMGHSALHCVTLLALARLGALTIPISPELSQASVGQLVLKYGVTTAVTDADPAKFGKTPVITLSRMSAQGNESDIDFLPYRPNASTPLRVALSSGTTGEAKGVLHTHGSLFDRIEKTFEDPSDEVRLLPPQFHLTMAYVSTMAVLCAGGTIVIPRDLTMTNIAAAVNLHAVTHMMLSPAAVSRMAAVLPEGGMAFRTLKHLRVVGATPTPAMLAVLWTRFSKNVFCPYGLTELGVVAMATPETLSQAPLSAGRLRPWARVEVVDEEGHRLPPGHSGALRIAIEPMPWGYYRDEDQSRKNFRDGWFYPGDIGHLSSEGLLFVEGRCDDILNIGGTKTLPVFVEDVLRRHPDVADAAVFQVPTSTGEAMLVAALKPRSTKIAGNLKEFCSRQNLGYLTPNQFLVVTDFPRNESGKLLRRALPDLVKTAPTSAGAARALPE